MVCDEKRGPKKDVQSLACHKTHRAIYVDADTSDKVAASTSVLHSARLSYATVRPSCVESKAVLTRRHVQCACSSFCHLSPS